MSKFNKISNLRWANTEKTVIDAEVIVSSLPNTILPYSFNNDEEHKEIFEKLILGEYGIIIDYIEPTLMPPIPVTYATVAEGIKAKRDEVIEKRIKSIALIRGTTVENLNNYEAKVARLATVAQEMRINPQSFYGQLFDGAVLPSDTIEITTIANNFISAQTIASQKIEEVIAQTDIQLLQIAACTTLDEIYTIVV